MQSKILSLVCIKLWEDREYVMWEKQISGQGEHFDFRYVAFEIHEDHPGCNL